jgi:hypothetical protein
MSGPLCQWCNLPSHSGGCDREALKRVIHELRALEAARAKIPGTGVIMIRSLISHRNQQPRVDIQVGEVHTQMDAAATMDVAKNIIECATGAFADSFIFNFMREKIRVDEGAGVMIIEEFRDYREKLQHEFDELQRGINNDGSDTGMDG